MNHYSRASIRDYRLEKVAFDPSMLGDLVQHGGQFIHHLSDPAVLKAGAGALAARAGFGAALHVGANAIMKPFLYGKLGGKKAQSWIAEQGFKHGVKGKELHPMAVEIGKQIISPEIMEPYHLANNLGKRFTKSPVETMGVLKSKMTDGVSPMLDYVKDGANTYLKNKSTAQGYASGVSNYLGNAVGTQPQPPKNLWGRLKDKAKGAMLISNEKAERLESNPMFRKARGAWDAVSATMASTVLGHAGDHIAVNTMRSATARTNYGKRAVMNNLESSLRGNADPTWKRNLKDYAISPGFGMTSEYGTNIYNKLPEEHRGEAVNYARKLLDNKHEVKANYDKAGISPNMTPDQKDGLYNKAMSFARTNGYPNAGMFNPGNIPK